jgi:hypothetical protein
VSGKNYVVRRCKQQHWKDLRAQHEQIRHRLSEIPLRIISPYENRRDLGHVPQLFSIAHVAHAVHFSVPSHHTVGASSFAARMSVLHIRLLARPQGWAYKLPTLTFE